MPNGSARHAFIKLVKKGIITRMTITLERLPIRYLAMMQFEYVNGNKFLKVRSRLLEEEIVYGKFINKYVYLGDMGIPSSLMFILPIFSESDLNIAMNNLRYELKGTSGTTILFTQVIVGSLCYRRFDNSYSRQQRILEEVYKATPAKRLDYT
jgi:DNA-binding Lrp family transcriptional regulator